MAGAGEDARLAEMLLEVALDLEAEAEAIEAEQRDARLMPAESPEPKPLWLWQLRGPCRELTGPSFPPAAESVR
nr:hypothetical protein [uncultured Rhodopila sp.]